MKKKGWWANSRNNLELLGPELLGPRVDNLFFYLPMHANPC